LTGNLYAGVEFSKRDLDVPVPAVRPDGTVTTTKENQNELLYLGYLYWSPLPDWAFSAQIVYDKFKGNQSLDVQAPTKVTMLSVPVFARYFNSLGIFGEVGATYVRQEVDRSFVSPLAQGDDSFVVVDAAVGYRLPKRYGILSVEVRNLFDNSFNFQGDNFRTSEPIVSRYVPERTVLGRITLTF
jgi:outer membrane receptor protein involved in Fe transport